MGETVSGFGRWRVFWRATDRASRWNSLSSESDLKRLSYTSRERNANRYCGWGQVTYAEPVVVQAYVPDPLLLDGFKFDLRIYVVVTSFAPLEAFVYRDGFARVQRLNSQVYD